MAVKMFSAHARYAAARLLRSVIGCLGLTANYLVAGVDIFGCALHTRKQPSKDAMLLLARREVLSAERRKLGRQHKARSTCDAELRAITHRLLSNA